MTNHSSSPALPPDFRAPSEPHHPKMRTTYLILGLLVIGAGVSLLLLLPRIVGESIPPLTQETFDAALARWQANGPSSYDIDLRIAGAQPGKVHVEVRNGVTVAMARDGRTPSQQRTWDVWAIPGQFDTIERELEMADDPANAMSESSATGVWLRCAWDPVLGFPIRFHRVVLGGGPEVYWEVVQFTPR